jgi:hypothetical protein
MAGKKREEVREKDIQGLKYFNMLLPLLERLHEVGCERDKAGNRELHFDQYCALILLSFFNPITRSVRGIQQASELRNVQRKLGCLRTSLGSFSEAKTIFAPEKLAEIVKELAGQLQPVLHDSRLQGVNQIVTLVDGTLIRGLPVMIQLALGGSPSAWARDKCRWHTQFDLERWLPVRIDVTGGIGKGGDDERAVLEKALEKGRCYVEDRGYAKFTLFNAIVATGSSYVCRMKDHSAYQVLEQRALSAEDREADVTLDALVQIGESSKEDARPDHPMRLVAVKITPHPKRAKIGKGSAASASRGLLLIATNRFDLPAWIIALLYRYRWTIEIFFRFLKHFLGRQHLLSKDLQGIQIEAYCAIIACMLINLWTGRKPTLRTYEMVCYYFLGLAEEDELLAHLAKLKAKDDAQKA